LSALKGSLRGFGQTPLPEGKWFDWS
jgi:hypothetical protein